jgi:hypothetical protein
MAFNGISRLRRTRVLAGVALAAACLSGCSGIGAQVGGPDDVQQVTNGAVVPPARTGPPADPFSGTPAAKWADGAAGITIPAAKPVQGFSAAQVDDAYQTAKKLLEAAALNQHTLDGEAPTAFADLLTEPQQKQFDSALDKIGVAKDGSVESSRGWIVSFPPGSTKLIGSAIKVTGTMSSRSVPVPGKDTELYVHVNYLFTYAVEPPKAPADWTRLVAQLDGNIEFGDWIGSNVSFTPWWNVGIGVAGARCGMDDGFQHPQFPSGPPSSVQPTGAPINPYSLNNKPGTGCQAVAGT